ncbi:MAG: shikimate kinase [bacterium]|nr:shikimate kinase [bacterium]
MKNIVLFGFMGTGKSSIGKILAERLDMSFLEMDEIIEKENKMTISDIFEKYGEAYFRELEKDLIERISKNNSCVISTGGGVVLNEENVELLQKNGILISLMAKEEVIYKRVKNETHRPLLKTKNGLQKIREILNHRRPFYEKAGFCIDTSNMSKNEVVEKIIEYAERQIYENSKGIFRR